MNSFSKFTHFTAHELAANESFQAYASRQNQEDILFWEKFISLYPAKRGEIQAATDMLSLLKFKQHSTSEALKQFELHRLLTSLTLRDEQDVALIAEKAPTSRSRTFQWRGNFNLSSGRLAASLTGIVVIFCAGLFLFDALLHPDQITYHTAYGENSTIVLPDGSTVIMNGNTKLYHNPDWNSATKREVWLDGEAFFDVVHKGNSGDAHFIVHTPGLDVEVLGTKFNVFNREDKANVVLNSGKVKVRIASVDDTSSVVMMPDEALEFSRKDQTFTKKQVKAEVLTSWRNKVLVFENTPLYKVGEMIEYTYGVQVIFRPNVDVSEELAGTIPSENLDMLLTVLAKSSNLDITRNKDQIIVDRKVLAPEHK